MQSNYKTLGKYIQKVENRNRDLKATKLLGINIDKFFMPSVANVIGTDMSAYKVVKKDQFACNRMHVGRDYRLPVALSRSNENFIVSPAYDVFEVINTEELLPEYLMMWFSRKEFDRNAWFYTDADVRGGLNWNALMEMQLPIPHIDKQKEIIKEYHTIVNRTALNNQLIQRLEETAQTIYKQWFLDFEFPDAKGKPYKSNNGEMEESELGEIPKGWKIKPLREICDVINGRAYAETEFKESGTPIIRIQNLSGGNKYVFSDLQLDKDKYVERGDLLFAWSATFGPFIWRGPKSIYHYHIWKLNCNREEFKFLIFNYFKLETQRVSGEGTGSIFTHITKGLMESQKIVVPSDEILKVFHTISKRLDNAIDLKISKREFLKDLNQVLLSKLATIEDLALEENLQL